MKINILDSSIYNKIAAGEVVENPAAVVKELVENSIDAGADKITVTIENGGIKSIEVSDNGSGIPKDELKNAILAHATSKISIAEDLNHISTLGFRGEALASIASVSEVEIKSKYFNADTGAQLISNASGITVRDIALNRGTTISVNGLFYNTPARYKFLRTAKGEGSTVTALMSKLILSNPLVSFNYYMDGKLIYASGGKGLWDAITAIYTPEITNYLIPIEELDGKVSICGYIGRGELYKSNRTFQTIILNGRVITDQNISYSLQNAYKERMMQRQFPVCILNIVMPFDEVDINVHPNKREVRFARPREVYGAVYQAVKHTLELYEQKLMGSFNIASEETKEEVAATVYEGQKPNPIKATQPTINPTTTSTNAAKTLDISEYLALLNAQQSKKALKLEESTAVFGAAEILQSRYAKEEKSETSTPLPQKEKDTTTKQPLNQEDGNRGEKLTSNTCTQIQQNSNRQAFVDYTVIGQLFSTYLMVETQDNFLIIDQHAAHERILYDRLVHQAETGEIHMQPMLLPYIYEGTPSDISIIEELIPELAQIGFDIQPFGNNSVKINATPLILSDINLSDFIANIITQYNSKKILLSGFIKDKLMQSACKAAIKGGDTLTDEQISFIIEYFISNSMPLKCPHGRPAYIAYTKYEIEKLFRRKL